MRSRLRIVALASALSAAALGQHALDANTSVTGGRINPKQVNPGMAKPIYTVNYRTGEMNYNRAKAFNDPTYNLYQQRALDPFNRTGQATVRQHAIPGVTDLSRGGASTGALRPPRGGTAMAPRGSGHALKKPKYTASGGGSHRVGSGGGKVSSGKVAGLKQPSYRVSGTRR